MLSQLASEYCALKHKFTMEMGRDCNFSFLDTVIYRRPDDSLGHRMYPPTPPSIETRLPSPLTQEALLPNLEKFFLTGVIQDHFQTEQL